MECILESPMAITLKPAVRYQVQGTEMNGAWFPFSIAILARRLAESRRPFVIRN
jgi:hypothetical protein